jgi:nucleoside-diphosphate-sugar epimerase
MKILIAGATGAIGTPLIRVLRNAGHIVFGMARSSHSASGLTVRGADAVIADALDAEAVRLAVLQVRPDTIINELTSLPKHYAPAEMKAAAPNPRPLEWFSGIANRGAHVAG